MWRLNPKIRSSSRKEMKLEINLREQISWWCFASFPVCEKYVIWKTEAAVIKLYLQMLGFHRVRISN